MASDLLTPALKITLPLPSKPLNPNRRNHWSKRSKAVKEARNVAKLVTLAALEGQAAPPIVSYSLHFYFKTAARRDDDNAAASFKSYRDGIADALRIDDHGITMRNSPEMNVDKLKPRLVVKLYTQP